MTRFRLHYTAASHRGSRAENQDNLRIGDAAAYADVTNAFYKRGTLCTGETQLLCVCDGVGGGAEGTLASRRALEAVAAYMRTPRNAPLIDIVRGAAQAAQTCVGALHQEIGIPEGCTLVMLGVRGREYVLLNVGDSPAFRWRHGENAVEELSIRHNLAWEKRRRGIGPEPEDYCVLTRYLGKPDTGIGEMAHISAGTLASGDVLLLCSDGVSEAFSEARMLSLLKKRIGAKRLVMLAAGAPEADNCTAICVTVKKKVWWI